MTADELHTRRPAITNVPDWAIEHYRQVDAGEVDAYTQDFDPDVELRFASRPPITGRGPVRDALARGHAEHRMEHTFVGCFESGDTTILEFDVVYGYPDGHSHLVPSVAILHRGPSGLLDSLRVYVERPR